MTTQLSSNESDICETIVTTSLANRFIRKFEKFNERFAPFDYFIYSGSVIEAIAELKCRFVTYETYPTIFLSARKVEQLKYSSLELQNALPLFLVSFIDGMIFGFDVRKLNLEWFGQMNRVKSRKSGHRGANDSEPGYYIPVNNMKFLNEMSTSELAVYRANES